VVASADGKGLPPPEQQLAGWCKEWGALPEEGGMLDQDIGLILRMTVSNNVYRTISKVRGMMGAQIHNLTDADRRIIRSLMDAGVFSG
jgi:hypothetical protein